MEKNWSFRETQICKGPVNTALIFTHCIRKTRQLQVIEQHIRLSLKNCVVLFQLRLLNGTLALFVRIVVNSISHSFPNTVNQRSQPAGHWRKEPRQETGGHVLAPPPLCVVQFTIAIEPSSLLFLFLSGSGPHPSLCAGLHQGVFCCYLLLPVW